MAEGEQPPPNAARPTAASWGDDRLKPYSVPV